MTNLLILANDPGQLVEGFEPAVDEVTGASLADAAIRVGDETRRSETRSSKHRSTDGARLTIDGVEAKQFDAVFLKPEPKAAIYGRVLLELLQERHIPCNVDASSFFIMTKKHYLLEVLEEHGVPLPPTVALSTEKGLTKAEEELDFPLMAKMYDGFQRVDITKIEDVGELKTFAEHAEHGKNVVIAQEFLEGDVYDALYMDGDIVSTEVEGGWKTDTENRSYTYHSLSSDQQDVVQRAAEAIGTALCRVKLVDQTVIQMESDLRLPQFREVSGKDVYGHIADVLVGDDG